MIDLTNKRFGKLLVLSRVGKNSNGNYKWLCKCDCGNEKEILGDSLKSGKTQSCGCLRKQRISEANTRHKGRGTRLHNIWLGMRSRCHSKGHSGFKNYGGRGITVCDEWDDYCVFKDWAISNGYADNLTIDRIDVNGNYEPSNCRWVTYKEQAKNKRVNQFLGE